MSGTLAGVTSLGSEVVLYVKIEWLPNGAQNVRFLAGFTLTHTHWSPADERPSTASPKHLYSFARLLVLTRDLLLGRRNARAPAHHTESGGSESGGHRSLPGGSSLLPSTPQFVLNFQFFVQVHALGHEFFGHCGLCRAVPVPQLGLDPLCQVGQRARQVQQTAFAALLPSLP